MVETILVLSALKVVTVLAGIVFLVWAGKAYLKHRTRNMATLFAAMALLTMAAIAEGIVFQLVGLSLASAHIVEALFTLAGFLVLVASVLVKSLRRTELGPPAEDLDAE